MKDIQITTKQDIKKKRAIELWGQTQGHISDICRTIDVTRKTFYTWLHNDPAFAEALLDAEAELNDDLKNVLVKKAGEGSTAELIFYLKSRHPDFKQSDKPTTAIQINNYRDVVKKINED